LADLVNSCFWICWQTEKHGQFYYAAANVISGAFLFGWLEGWSWLDSFYFVIITLTTIGYGDLSPTIPVTKLLTIFYALNGVAILLMLLDEMRRLRLHRLDKRVDELRSLDEATPYRPVRDAILDSRTAKRDDLVTGIALPTGGADS
jgi:hypothetical protein